MPITYLHEAAEDFGGLTDVLYWSIPTPNVHYYCHCRGMEYSFNLFSRSAAYYTPYEKLISAEKDLLFCLRESPPIRQRVDLPDFLPLLYDYLESWRGAWDPDLDWDFQTQLVDIGEFDFEDFPTEGWLLSLRDTSPYIDGRFRLRWDVCPMSWLAGGLPPDGGLLSTYLYLSPDLEVSIPSWIPEPFQFGNFSYFLEPPSGSFPEVVFYVVGDYPSQEFKLEPYSTELGETKRRLGLLLVQGPGLFPGSEEVRGDQDLVFLDYPDRHPWDMPFTPGRPREDGTFWAFGQEVQPDPEVPDRFRRGFDPSFISFGGSWVFETYLEQISQLLTDAKPLIPNDFDPDSLRDWLSGDGGDIPENRLEELSRKLDLILYFLGYRGVFPARYPSLREGGEPSESLTLGEFLISTRKDLDLKLGAFPVQWWSFADREGEDSPPPTRESPTVSDALADLLTLCSFQSQDLRSIHAAAWQSFGWARFAGTALGAPVQWTDQETERGFYAFPRFAGQVGVFGVLAQLEYLAGRAAKGTSSEVAGIVDDRLLPLL